MAARRRGAVGLSSGRPSSGRPSTGSAVGLAAFAGTLVVTACLASCAQAPLPALPTTAAATGVAIEGSTESGPYTLAFAGASGDVFAGTVDATTTTVSRTEGAGPPLQIQAARSSWDLKARSARFEGEVVVTRGAVTMRCTALDVHYASADVLDTVVATGTVRVDHGERHAEAERAELVGASGKITLSGHPKLSEGVNVLSGERIILWLDDEKADCEGGPSGPCALTVAGEALGPR